LLSVREAFEDDRERTPSTSGPGCDRADHHLKRGYSPHIRCVAAVTASPPQLYLDLASPYAYLALERAEAVLGRR
jgi:hypothetical protein